MPNSVAALPGTTPPSILALLIVCFRWACVTCDFLSVSGLPLTFFTIAATHAVRSSESIVLQPNPSAVCLTETGMTQFWDRADVSSALLPPVEACRHHVSRLARTLPSVSLHTRSHANGDPNRGTHRMPPSGGCRQDRGTSRVMKQRLLNQLHEVTLSPSEAWGLLERVKINTSSAEDRERLAHLIRVTTQMTDQLRAELDVPTPSVSQRPSQQYKAKRKCQLAKAVRRRHRR